MGLWYALRPSCRRAGLAIAVAGTVVSLVAVAVVVPHYAPGGGSPFEGRYSSVGGSPGGIAKTAVTDPGTIVGELTDGRDLAYLADLLLPLLALPLLAPLDRADRGPGAAPQPPLRHAHADLDPLPLHGRRAPRPVRGRGARSRASPSAVRLGTPARGTRGRRIDGRRRAVPRPAAALASRAVRLGPRRRASTSSAHTPVSPRQALRLDPAGRSRERDEHARGPPVRTTPGLQLPGAPGSRVGRGRPDEAELSRPGRRTGSVRRRVRQVPGERPLRAGVRRRTGSSCSGSERDRLRQEVRRERERGQSSDPVVVLRRRERDRPREVPDGEVRGRREHEAGGAAETQRPARRVASEPGEADGQRSEGEREGGAVGNAELVEP